MASLTSCMYIFHYNPQVEELFLKSNVLNPSNTTFIFDKESNTALLDQINSLNCPCFVVQCIMLILNIFNKEIYIRDQVLKLF
jgi:hypothetical protein